MPSKTATDPRDKAARAAFRSYCQLWEGYAAVADQHGLNRLTAKRIYRGERSVPPGLAREIAEFARDCAWHNIYDPMENWADHCEARNA